nr:unnamed protein product [Callosobruchus analis]
MILLKESFVKNLGIVLDEELRFSERIKHKLQTAYFNLKSIYQSREKTALRCDTIYDECLKSSDKYRIQKLQNSCLRLLYCIRKYDHISHKLKDANWLHMKNRGMIHILKSNEPQYLFEKMKFRTETHNVNLRSKHQLTLGMRDSNRF